jgi:hypothetical protein
MAGYKLGSVASTIDGHGFHILRADNSLVVHFNFKTDEKAKMAHERLAGWRERESMPPRHCNVERTGRILAYCGQGRIAPSPR